MNRIQFTLYINHIGKYLKLNSISCPAYKIKFINSHLIGAEVFFIHKFVVMMKSIYIFHEKLLYYISNALAPDI